jgi:hypothetical protein
MTSRANASRNQGTLSGKSRRRRNASAIAFVSRMVTQVLQLIPSTKRGPNDRAMAVLLILALLIAPGLGSSILGASLQTPAVQHTAADLSGVDDHGHHHDDGKAGTDALGHLHGHDPADHSHQVGFVPQVPAQVAPSTSREWPGDTPSVVAPSTPDGIERPPKPVLRA